MKKAFWVIAILLLGPQHVLWAAEPDGVEITHFESLDDLSLGTNELDSAQSSFAAERLTMAFHAFGQRFELDLEANERLIARALKGRVRDEIGVYRGRITGREGSWVRLVVSNGVQTGLIWDGEQMFAIEPQWQKNGAGSESVMYRLSDVYIEPGTMGCGASSAKATDLATAYKSVTAELNNAVVGEASAMQELNIGVVSDFELTQRLGAETEVEMLARINNVDGIFSEQLGVQITAREVETFAETNDPFTSAAPSDLLKEVTAYRVATPAQKEQGITYLFTGRDLDGSTVGTAYYDALCSERFGVGLSEANRGVITDSLIMAHEVGHIFNAPHDGVAGSACESVTGEFLMAPRVNGSDQFSSCSISIMRPTADAASCLNPLPESDVELILAGGVPDLLLGDSVAVDFDVVNNGSVDAGNVAAVFDIPTHLEVSLVTTTAGSCSSGAGQVDCTLGGIAGNATERVRLAVNATAVGTASINATVTADTDTDPANNDLRVPVSVSPATDLLVRGSAGASVTLNDTVSIRPSVENKSSFGATNVALSISFSSGLRVDSASWPNGTCSVSASTVSCERSSFAAQSDVAVDIQLTAVSVGSQSYNATVSADEVDRDEGNNSVTGTVTVSEAPASGDGGTSGSDSGGGGGALSLVWLLLTVLVRLTKQGFGAVPRFSSA